MIIKTQPMKGPACESSLLSRTAKTRPDRFDFAGRARWDEQIGFYSNEAVTNRILFHQFEPHLLAADDKGNIT